MLIPLALRAKALAGLEGKSVAIVRNSLVQIVAPFLLITYGADRITSSLTGILVASAPIFTALLSIYGPARGPQSTRWSMGGIVAGIVGVALLFGVDLTGDSTRADRRPDGAAAPVSATRSARSGSGATSRASQPLGVATATMTTSAVLLRRRSRWRRPTVLPGAKAIGSVARARRARHRHRLLHLLQLIADVGPSKASIVAYLAPVFALFYGALFLNESVTDRAPSAA